METTVMNVAVSHGIWAVLAVFLLVYIVKSNEKRDEKQEEREKNYQSVIEKLTEKLEIYIRYKVIYQKSKRIFLVSISRSKNSGIKLSRENLFFEVCKAEIKNSLSSRICKFEKI